MFTIDDLRNLMNAYTELTLSSPTKMFSTPKIHNKHRQALLLRIDNVNIAAEWLHARYKPSTSLYKTSAFNLKKQACKGGPFIFYGAFIAAALLLNYSIQYVNDDIYLYIKEI